MTAKYWLLHSAVNTWKTWKWFSSLFCKRGWIYKAVPAWGSSRWDTMKLCGEGERTVVFGAHDWALVKQPIGEQPDWKEAQDDQGWVEGGVGVWGVGLVSSSGSSVAKSTHSALIGINQLHLSWSAAASGFIQVHRRSLTTRPWENTRKINCKWTELPVLSWKEQKSDRWTAFAGALRICAVGCWGPGDDPGSQSRWVAVKPLTVKLFMEPPHAAPHGAESGGQEAAPGNWNTPRGKERLGRESLQLIGPENPTRVRTLNCCRSVLEPSCRVFVEKRNKQPNSGKNAFL